MADSVADIYIYLSKLDVRIEHKNIEELFINITRHLQFGQLEATPELLEYLEKIQAKLTSNM